MAIKSKINYNNSNVLGTNIFSKEEISAPIDNIPVQSVISYLETTNITPRDYYKGTSFRYSGEWLTGTHYLNDQYFVDFVVINNVLLRCKKSHLSSLESKPVRFIYDDKGNIVGIDSEYWDFVLSGFNVGEGSNFQRYYEGNTSEVVNPGEGDVCTVPGSNTSYIYYKGEWHPWLYISLDNITNWNNKADKVHSAVAGHIATLDSSGNLVDSGKGISDINPLWGNIQGSIENQTDLMDALDEKQNFGSGTAFPENPKEGDVFVLTQNITENINDNWETIETNAHYRHGVPAWAQIFETRVDDYSGSPETYELGTWIIRFSNNNTFVTDENEIIEKTEDGDTQYFTVPFEANYVHIFGDDETSVYNVIWAFSYKFVALAGTYQYTNGLWVKCITEAERTAWNAKYDKPQNGIPYTDLAGNIPKTKLESAVQTSLGKADTAYQKPVSGIPASDLADGVIPDVSNFITKSVNDLVNYYTKSETYTKGEVNSLIGAINQFHYEIAASTSAVTTPASNVLYLIGPTGSGTDKYEEYVYANNNWVKIGDTSIDLSGYVTIQALNTALSAYTTTDNLNTLLAKKQSYNSGLTLPVSGQEGDVFVLLYRQDTDGGGCIGTYSETSFSVPSWATHATAVISSSYTGNGIFVNGDPFIKYALLPIQNNEETEFETTFELLDGYRDRLVAGEVNQNSYGIDITFFREECIYEYHNGAWIEKVAVSNSEKAAWNAKAELSEVQRYFNSQLAEVSNPKEGDICVVPPTLVPYDIPTDNGDSAITIDIDSNEVTITKKYNIYDEDHLLFSVTGITDYHEDDYGTEYDAVTMTFPTVHRFGTYTQQSETFVQMTLYPVRVADYLEFSRVVSLPYVYHNGEWELINYYIKPTGGIPWSDLSFNVQESLGYADTAYQKPYDGIPKTDLASSVQTSLNKADSAIQTVRVNGTTMSPDSYKAVNITIPLKIYEIEPDEFSATYIQLALPNNFYDTIVDDIEFGFRPILRVLLEDTSSEDNDSVADFVFEQYISEQNLITFLSAQHNRNYAIHIDSNNEVELYDNFLELTRNKVTSWSNSTSDIKYPSEKLVKDSLDGKQDNMVMLTYGTSTWNDFIDAYNKNAVVYCNANGRMAFMAYKDSSGVEFQYYRSKSTHSEAEGDNVFVYKLTTSGSWSTTERPTFGDIYVAKRFGPDAFSRITDGAVRKGRLLFSSADNTKWVPSSTSTETSENSAKPVNQTKINPFGLIVRYPESGGNKNDGATISASDGLWYNCGLKMGFAFNPSGTAWTLTNKAPIYLKCAPQSDGSAIMDATTPIVQTLPSTEDGKIYIYLGQATNATQFELTYSHPIYYYKDGAIREWVNSFGNVEYFDVTYNVTTVQQLKDAIDAGKTPRIVYDDLIIPLVSCSYPSSLVAPFDAYFTYVKGNTIYQYVLIAGDVWSSFSNSIPDISTNITSDATSDIKTASPKAVKTFVESNFLQLTDTLIIDGGNAPSSQNS